MKKHELDICKYLPTKTIYFKVICMSLIWQSIANKSANNVGVKKINQRRKYVNNFKSSYFNVMTSR